MFMDAILRFPLPSQVLQNSERAFDAEVTALICQAFDKTCRALHDAGQSESVKEIIAKRIIAIAGRGERDPDKMCADALTSLGLNPSR
jgi:hypothetical protein